MGNTKINPLVWLDMEMTGLDPETCVPIQVAIVMTDNDLNEIEALELNIWQPESALEPMEPYVRNMHTDNGLLDAIRACDTSVHQAEQKMLGFLSRHCDFREGILAGNSIHQDRKFLDRYFPAFSGFLHYRMIDVSSLKELVRRWYGSEYQFVKSDAANHTALADIRESIAELEHYRAAFMMPGEGAS